MAFDEQARGRPVSIVLHTFDRGGSGRVAGYLARGFADLGAAVELVVFSRGGDVEASVVDLIGPGIPIRYLGRSHGWRPLDLIVGLPKLMALLRSEPPATVIAAANNVALVCGIALRLTRLSGTKLYLKTTNPIASSRHRGIVRAIRLRSYRTVFRRATAVWTLSAEESREMVSTFPEHAGIFHDVANPYVTPAMLHAPSNTVPKAPGKTIIAVARLAKQKRLDRLIRAFAEVKDRSARLLILGEGEERTVLAALVDKLRLQDRVSMPGHVPDVVPSLNAADLFVLTSDYEGLPAVVLEAMAANCPVLGTNCFPSARSLLGATEGCAIITDTRPDALARLIDEHLDRARPTHLRALAERFSIANGVASHAAALQP